MRIDLGVSACICIEFEQPLVSKQQRTTTADESDCVAQGRGLSSHAPRGAAVSLDSPTSFGIVAAVLFWRFLFLHHARERRTAGADERALRRVDGDASLKPLYSPPPNWYLAIVCGFYPIGAVLIGEGVFRLALLMTSRRRGEKEWVRIMASTYRDHVIVCGVGHLGVRVIEHLVLAQVPCVALERSKTGRFVAHAAELNVPILIRDMKEDQALKDAGIEHG